MFPPVLPSFPQPPQTLVTRQLECVRCHEIFTIAEDWPNQFGNRTQDWRVPPNQYPATPLRYNNNREQVGVIPEFRTEPAVQIQTVHDPALRHHLNCPRCGADNRNWLFVSTQLRIHREPTLLVGGLITFILLLFIIFSSWPTLFEGRTLALICLVLAAGLPLFIIPQQWGGLRNFQMVSRFLPMVPQPRIPPTLQTAVTLYIGLILLLPAVRYAVLPAAQNAAAALQQAISQTERDDVVEKPRANRDEAEFWEDWLFLGTAVSVFSSSVALVAVGAIFSRVNNQLPRPIYANTSNMVRVALWEAKRALEIDVNFHQIQWMMTRRNEQGGINMVGYFRDPPEFSANGHLEEQVRVQKYTISTDRWCVITHAKIEDTKVQRPAKGDYNSLFVPKSETPIAISGRKKY